ncbi:hypothetical protein Dimus_000559 [Dionaea muscipula]
MAAPNLLLKGGGTILIFSCCNRTTNSSCFFIPRRPRLLSPSRRPFSLPLLLPNPPLSPSHSTPSLLCSTTTTTIAAIARCTSSRGVATFCKATDVGAATAPLVDSSSPLPAEAASAAADLGAVKEAAGLLDIRVGRILKAWRHPDADSLYVEEIDIGESEPRIICSGLVNYVPLEHLQDKLVVVLANLKPRNMRGVKSSGMLMAASDASHENVELLVPPESSVPGERITFGLQDEQESQPVAATSNQIQKKKIWELVQPHLKTNASCTVMLGEHIMRTSGGPVVSKSLKHANVS